MANWSSAPWSDYAACHVYTADDKSFIIKPNDRQAKEWAAICAKCPVFEECESWSKRLKVSGVFTAGEWRDDEKQAAQDGSSVAAPTV